MRPVVTTLVLLVGCTPDQPSRISLREDLVLPAGEQEASPPRRHGAKPERKTVFLNFEGGPLYCGLMDDATQDVSAIICNLTYPRFEQQGFACYDEREACIAEIVGLVRELWRDFAIDFVTERPERGDYEMVMVGGEVTSGPAAGLAMLDCDDRRPANVVFAFSGSIAGEGTCSKKMLATTISQELAHGLGLCHNDDCWAPVTSVMCPQLITCSSDWGTGCLVDACPCYSGCEDPHEMLIELLGPSETEPPTVQILSPDDGLTVPCGPFTVWVAAGDQTAIGRVLLFEGAALLGELDEPPYEFLIADPDTGDHQYRAVAYDSIGNRAETTTTITVDCDAACIPGSCCCGESCCRPVCDCLDRTPTGGACESDADCQGDLCVSLDEYPGEGGACAELCRADADCPAGFSCIEEEGRNICREDVWADSGEPCEADTDCATALCVSSRCSIPCDTADNGACPADLDCRSGGDGEGTFCLARPSSDGGCTLARTSAGPGPWWVLLALLLARRRR